MYPVDSCEPSVSGDTEETKRHRKLVYNGRTRYLHCFVLLPVVGMLTNNLRIQIQGKHQLAALATLAFSQCFFSSLNAQSTESEAATNSNSNADGYTNAQSGADTKDEELFENQCLKRQMYIPKVPYPAWDYNWDGNETPETSLEAAKQGRGQAVKGKTRHVILVRHGQYDESSEKDEERILTPLGRLQAIQTGKRLREIMNGSESFASTRFRGPCPISAVRVSSMTRAKETAELIAAELGLQVEDPDPDLNEAIPAPIIPIRHDIARTTEEIDQHHDRIERAFQRYIYRSQRKQRNKSCDNEDKTGDEPQDEFEIIVCHGNVIRYFFCRALQLPPEAWLRMSTFNCSLTYFVIRPTGNVSCRMMGDIGHLKYDEVSFSGYYGFKW